MGIKSLGAGKSFETYLDFLHGEYRKRGLAHIEYTGTRSRAVKTKGGMIKFISSPSMPDYVGVLAGGRAIVFDAKTTQNKYTWSLHRDRIHQRDTLSRWSEFGAVAFFMVERRPANSLYLLRIPPDQFDPVHPPPKITWSKVHEDVLIVEADNIGNYDYLPIISRFWLDFQ